MSDNYPIGVKKTAQITTAFPSINPNWLLFGTGDMFLEGTEEYDKEILPTKDRSIIFNKSGIKFKELTPEYYLMKVPVFPAYAHAKYLDEFRDVMSWESAEFAYFPAKQVHRGKYMAFEIKGDSMDDGSKHSLSNGDIVNTRELNRELWKDKLHINKFPNWIIVTETSILCKEITNHDVENGIITCHCFLYLLLLLIYHVA